MNATTKALGLALVMGGCAGDGVAPDWWELTVSEHSPVGGDWHYEDGRCLFTGGSQVEWAGDTRECRWFDGDDGAHCAITSTEGYTLVPFHARDGYEGGVWFTAPDGEVLPLQSGCWDFGAVSG
jgi:hypothetical protein